MHGNEEDIALWHNRIKPYYGKRVKVTLNGFRRDPDTLETHRIQITRVRQLDHYSDMFGPGSVYAQMAKVVRNRASNDELVASSIAIDTADEFDGDDEMT